MTKQNREWRGELQRELNKHRATAQQRFEAYAILDQQGLWSALIYVRRLPVRVR